MTRDIYKESAQHDLVDSRKGPSNRHIKDKKEKAARSRVEYTATIATAREAGSGIVDGVFDTEGMQGFCICRDEAGELARAQDDRAYILSAVRMSRERAKYRYSRNRNGKQVLDVSHYRHGGVSLISTLAPWQVGVMKRMPEAERIAVMLERAKVEAEVVERLTGRPTWGQSIHFDVAVPHAHSHYPKSRKGTYDQTGNYDPGDAFPKSLFCTIGGATVGWDRIERRFPSQGLVSRKNLERMNSNLSKKYDDGRFLVDIEVARACDQWFEKMVKQRRLEEDYSADLERYRSRKVRALREEKYRGMWGAMLKVWEDERTWHAAYYKMSRAMRLSMWRCIPKEHRLAIRVFLIASRLFFAPTKVVAAMTLNASKRKLIELLIAPPEMKVPVIK